MSPYSPHARFPWLQGAFCAACLGMAAWLWMRYSYAWDVSPRHALDLYGPGLYDGRWDGPFVRLSGRADSQQWFLGGTVTALEVMDCGDPHTYVLARLPPEAEAVPPRRGSEVRFTGRLVLSEMGPRYYVFLVDTGRGRFHPASIAGLVVGAMGVFIFALYLRRWLMERKRDSQSA